MTAYTVTADDAGERLDVFLARRGLGRARARRLIEEGRVRVAGRRAPKSTRLIEGAVVEIEGDAVGAHFAPRPNVALPLVVVHEDPRFVVVDKPAGQATHPLEVGDCTTLASALVARYPEMQGVGYALREPGVVHRLDAGTSGLLVAARDPEAFALLRGSLREGRFDKRYLALVRGIARAGTIIDAEIAADPKDARRVVACQGVDATRLGAKRALTELVGAEVVRTEESAAKARVAGAPIDDVASVEPDPLRRGGGASSEPATEAAALPAATLVEARARAARRHQVRVHLASIGHPLFGDALYGGPAWAGLSRHFLHASVLAFPHPSTGAVIRCESALPADLAAVVRALRARSSATRDEDT